ncbi:putative papain-like cysteine peptidase superfamily [Helianthus debilis subsp. tardiflorus]
MQAFTLNEEEEKMKEEFTQNIEKILHGPKLKSINDFKLIIVPILHLEHFFVILFNLEEKQISIIDNSAKEVTNKQKYGDVPEKTVSFPTYGFKTQYKQPNLFMEMKWRTKDNSIDCGIFCMRHMECYNGEEVEKWNCGFHKEYEQPAIIKKGKNKKQVNKQTAQLEDLIRKFITKILLHDLHERKDYVIEDSRKFRNLSAKLKKLSYDTSLERIQERLALAGL